MHTNVFRLLTEQDILAIGSKLNIAYLFRKQTRGTKPSAPTSFIRRKYSGNMTLKIEVRNPRDPDMMRILQTHLDFCMSSTPIEHVHALDVSKLTTPDITVFGGKLDGELVAVGAIRILDSTHAELKSMHTLRAARGRGVGHAIVESIEKFASERGITRLSLETGTNDAFKSARDLYQSMGFRPCEAFGEYENTEDNICMTKYLP